MHDDSIEVRAEVKCIYKTGVEMEALTAAGVAALTLYDMLKMLDEPMEISSIRLIEKAGGKSDYRQKIAGSLKAAVLVLSDSVSGGKKSDVSGRIIEECLKNEGVDVVDYRVLPDDLKEIQETVKEYLDETEIDLLVTTGGTGTSPTDCTPEAIRPLIERELPGITEAIRAYGQERTPYSMLSRSIAGIKGTTVIICLPGSSRGVSESLEAIFPAVLHAFKMLRGGRHGDEHRHSLPSGALRK